MKSEETEMNCKPKRSNLVKLVPLLALFVIQMTHVTAGFSLEDDVLRPVWDEIMVDVFFPLAGVVAVAICIGKASMVDGIPTWTKGVLGVIGTFVCLAIACAFGSVGGTDIGDKFENFLGDINLFSRMR